VQFSHKNITNPTVTHTDKIMQVISACENSLKGTKNGGTDLEICQVENVKERTKNIVEQCVIPSDVPQAPRSHNGNNQARRHVPPQTQHNFVSAHTPGTEPVVSSEPRRQTCAMAHSTQPSPRVAEQSFPRVMQSSITSSKKQAKKLRVKLYMAAREHTSASNTSSKRSAHEASAQPLSDLPETSSRILWLMQPTRTSKAKLKAVTSNAIETRRENR
jgi:hypothetical protein